VHPRHGHAYTLCFVPQPTNDLVHIGVKSAALVVAVFVDFPKNKCNFLHKNKLDIVRRVQFLTGPRPIVFSPGAVAAIALWKSAHMAQCGNVTETLTLTSILRRLTQLRSVARKSYYYIIPRIDYAYLGYNAVDRKRLQSFF